MTKNIPFLSITLTEFEGKNGEGINLDITAKGHSGNVLATLLLSSPFSIEIEKSQLM